MARKVRRRKPSKPRPKRWWRRYSTGELFMAALGAAFLVLAVALVVSALLGPG